MYFQGSLGWFSCSGDQNLSVFIYYFNIRCYFCVFLSKISKLKVSIICFYVHITRVLGEVLHSLEYLGHIVEEKVFIFNSDPMFDSALGVSMEALGISPGVFLLFWANPLCPRRCGQAIAQTWLSVGVVLLFFGQIILAPKVMLIGETSIFSRLYQL